MSQGALTKGVGTQLADARGLIAEADQLVAFTGAGISTASGIPDFRSPGGLWSQFDPEDFHYDRFLADPKRFWTLRAKLTRALKLDEARPNAAHQAMGTAVQEGRLAAIITQNIDGLHQAGGAPDEKVIEVHGTTRHARCIKCGTRMPIAEALEQIDDGELPPYCKACMGVVKPDVVLFGEVLPFHALQRAQELAIACDVMLVVGSSLSVWPAAEVPHLVLEHGGQLVLVNDSATHVDDRAAFVLRGRVEEVVPDLLGGV